MNHSTRNWIEGRVREVKEKLTDEAGRIVVHPTLGPDGRDEQTASTFRRVIGKIKNILGK